MSEILTSSPVVSGEDAVGEQYNNLWTDLMQHTHTGNGTAQVDHADLLNCGTTPHSRLDTHVGNDNNSSSGEKGVHGIPSDMYVLGSNKAKFVVVGGKVNKPDSTEIVVVQFGVTFADAAQVTVVATPLDTNKQAKQPVVHSITQTQFTLIVDNQDAMVFCWMAMGPMA